MNQSTTVAVIVVASFGAGFFVGRTSAPSNSTLAPPVAVAPPSSAPPPFPGTAPVGPPLAARGPMMNAPPPMMNAPQADPSGGTAQPVTGKVQEIIQVPNFTYLRLDTGHGDEWAAIPTNDKLKQGDQAAIAHPLKMNSFNSKTLNRTFDSIWFGELQQ
jgi:hypothetical protein